jgi:hypothetical protein
VQTGTYGIRTGLGDKRNVAIRRQDCFLTGEENLLTGPEERMSVPLGGHTTFVKYLKAQGVYYLAVAGRCTGACMLRTHKEEKGSPPISRVLSRSLATAGQSFLWAARYRDALAAYPGTTRATLTSPYLALPRMGFTVPVLLPVLRWALTPPFHPYLIFLRSHRRSAFCCTFRRLGSCDL